LSGFSALVYELTWVKFLKNIFGSDSYALSTLLTVFIGGIAIGTYLSGEFLSKYFSTDKDDTGEISNNINWSHTYILIIIFALIELSIGIYSLCMPVFLSDACIGRIWGIFASFCLELSFFGVLIKFLLASIFILLPTILMGLSFPLVTEILVEKNPSEHGNKQLITSNLYATNTLGAIIGVTITGFCLLPNIGLALTNNIAATVNISIGLSLIGLLIYNHLKFKIKNPFMIFDFAYKYYEARIHLLAFKKNLTFSYSEDFKLLAIIGFALGFINLGLEVTWGKLLPLVIGSSTYSLTIILASVLMGISLGAYLLNAFIYLINKNKWQIFSCFKFLLFVFAIVTALSVSIVNLLPEIFLSISRFFDIFVKDSGFYLWQDLIKFLLAFILTLPVTLVEGMIFALILYLVSGQNINLSMNSSSEQEFTPVGTKISKISFLNTLGAILGSFITGFVLIPLFASFGAGIILTLKAFIIIAICIAFASLKLEQGKISQILVISLSITSLLIMLLMPRFNTEQLSSGASLYSALKFRNQRSGQLKDIEEKVLFYQEGLNATISVIENKTLNAVFLKSNGKIEAGMPIDPSIPSSADMSTQMLLGYLPILVKPNSQKALLIGMGSGISLEALAVIGGKFKLSHIDVCELEKLVFKVAEKFFIKKFSSDIKIDKYNADARSFLFAQNPNKDTLPNYDLIISQPSDPWLSSGLFTEEFWRLASRNLSSTGAFAQWLQLYSIEPEYLKIVLKTFHKVFPNVIVFKPQNSAELILIGSKRPLSIDLHKFKEIFEDQEFSQDLAYIGIHDEYELLANLVLTPASVEDLLSGALTYNTDNNMLIEFHTYQNLSKFFKTIKSNEEYLSKFSSADSINRFLNLDSQARWKLSNAHANFQSPLHRSLAKSLAETASEFRALALLDFSFRQSDFTNLDELKQLAAKEIDQMHESLDLTDFIRSSIILGFYESAIQLANHARTLTEDEKILAKINLYEARIHYNILRHQLKQIVMPDNNDDKEAIYSSIEDEFLHAKLLLANSYHLNPFNEEPYIALADLNLLSYPYAVSHQVELLEDTDWLLSKASKINPNNYKTHELSAKRYILQLPESQLAFMQMIKEGGANLKNVDKGIETLAYSLQLNPRSAWANYQMAKIQYMLGNIDNTVMHLNRLKILCQDEIYCRSQLSEKELANFDSISLRLAGYLN
jgi:spermidine synthase